MEITPLEKSELKTKRELAEGIITQLKNLVFQAGLTFVEIGRLLKIVRDQKLYEYAGEGGYDTFTEFIADSDISIAPSTAYAFIFLYEKYILGLGFSEEKIAGIPWYKLHLLATKVKPKTKEEAEEWIGKAQTLSISDFKAELAEAESNLTGEKKLVYPTIQKCSVCGNWKVLTDQICTCT